MHASWLAGRAFETYAASIAGACENYNKIIALRETIKAIGR
jgi:hypothetical protein